MGFDLFFWVKKQTIKIVLEMKALPKKSFSIGYLAA